LTLRLLTWVKVKVAHKVPIMLAVILVVENNRTVNYGQNIEPLLNCVLRTNFHLPRRPGGVDDVPNEELRLI